MKKEQQHLHLIKIANAARFERGITKFQLMRLQHAGNMITQNLNIKHNEIFIVA